MAISRLFQSQFRSQLTAFTLITLLSPVGGAMAAATQEDQQSSSTPFIAQGYVKDDLFIFMHSGPNKNFRIVGSVTAGTPLQLLDRNEETGYIQIKDDKERIGWIDKDNFSTEFGSSLKLQRLQAQYDQLLNAQQDNQGIVDDLQRQLSNTRSDNEDKIKKLVTLENENETLKSQQALSSEENIYKERLYGAGIIAGGILSGLLIPSLLPRRRRKDTWV